MSVQNAGHTIHEARKKASLSQEKLSEGICSPYSLSRIENNTAGVSPATFQTLMAHTGVFCEAYPSFANRTDFNCFYALKRAQYFLDFWQLQSAFQELKKIENMNWADNKFYYQEWLLASCRLQIRSGCQEHRYLYETLLTALKISRPNFKVCDIHKLFLSVTELRLLILLANEALLLNKEKECSTICTQLETYLANSPIDFLEKKQLSAELNIAYTKYLISVHDYRLGLEKADTSRKEMVSLLIDAPLFELTFLTGLCQYYLKNETDALLLFKSAFYSAHSIGSSYATICLRYLRDCLHLSSFVDEAIFPEIPLLSFPYKKVIDTSLLNDGTYDLSSPDVLHFGDLIRELRTEQKISQSVLCCGLCSKSKLSKIENNTLQPDIILSQTLLQRLGISDTVFHFFGSEREVNLQIQKTQLMKISKLKPELILESARKMEASISSKNTLYKQFLLFKKALCEPNPAIQIQQLTDTLSMTCPDFEFYHQLSLPLSWTELTILNNLCYSYSRMSPTDGIQKYYQLLNFLQHSPMDIMLKRRFSPVTNALLIENLYREKRFDEIVQLSQDFFSSSVYGSLYIVANVYAHYYQALYHLSQHTYVQRYATYAYYGFNLTMRKKNASQLLQEASNEYHIQIL